MVRAVVAGGFARRLLIVAPDRGRSECSHAVTTGRGLNVRRRDDLTFDHGDVPLEVFETDGTPADCVRVATAAVAPDIDLVCSGINAGANVGLDVYWSGTVAAAREAALNGIAAVAVSHYRHPDYGRTWDHVGAWMRDVWDRTVLAGSVGLWNVNLPAFGPGRCDPSSAAVPDVVHASVETSPMIRRASIDDGVYGATSGFHDRPRVEGSDVERCFAGAVTISELTIDPTRR